MLERGTKERTSTSSSISVEDEGAYTTPWTASIIYLRDRLEWPEIVCAENTHEYYNKKESDVPYADKGCFGHDQFRQSSFRRCWTQCQGSRLQRSRVLRSC
jgi:hypothetical protein